jgi:glycosyltransferase involved in cell wall biosynthesis
MKILVIAPLPPYHRGGIEKVVGEVAKRISQSHSADVNVWSGTLGEAEASDWNGVSVQTYRTSKRVGYASLKMLEDLKRFARDFDVIHAHGSSTLIPLIAALGAANTPLVVSPHFHPMASNKLLGVVKPLFERTVHAYALGKATRIICVSETEAQAIRERFAVADKIATIYNGVDVEAIRKAESYRFNGKLILYVGRLERYKNIHRVIEAIGCLPQYFSFYVIGEGPYKSHLEALIRRSGLSERVKLLGECSDAHLYRWIKTSALLVNWSEVEAFGITVLEALAAGTPALVNDKFGLHEIALRFGRAVSVISPKRMSPRELARAINDAAGADVGPVDLDDFRWDRIAAKTLALYEKALAA